MFYKKAVMNFAILLEKKPVLESLIIKVKAFTRNIWETYFKELLQRAASENYFLDISMHLKSSSGINICDALSKGGSGTVAASKIEHLVIIVNGWKPLTIMAKRSILDIRLCFWYRYILKKNIFSLMCKLSWFFGFLNDWRS